MNENSPKYSLDINIATIFRFLAVVAALYFLYLIRDIVAILFFSILLILILQTPVNFLNRYKIPKPLAVIMIYLLMFAFFALAVILIIPPIGEQISQIAVRLGQYWINLTHFFGLPDLSFDPYQLQLALKKVQTYLPNATGDIFTRITDVVRGFIALVIVMVVTFYGLVEESAFKRIVRSIVPSNFQPYLYQIAIRVQKKLGMWARGQLLLGFIIFCLSFVGLSLLKVDYALTLAIVSGILEFIPYLGPIISAFFAVMLTVAVSPVKALLVLILYVVMQQIENHILVPKIMQRAVGLNPVVSIIALLIGGKLGGVIGLLLAIPVTTALSVFVQDMVDQKSEGQLGLDE